MQMKEGIQAGKILKAPASIVKAILPDFSKKSSDVAAAGLDHA